MSENNSYSNNTSTDSIEETGCLAIIGHDWEDNPWEEGDSGDMFGFWMDEKGPDVVYIIGGSHTSLLPWLESPHHHVIICDQGMSMSGYPSSFFELVEIIVPSREILDLCFVAHTPFAPAPISPKTMRKWSMGTPRFNQQIPKRKPDFPRSGIRKSGTRQPKPKM